MLVLSSRLTYIQGRKQREYIRLNCGHEYLDQTDEQNNDSRTKPYPIASEHEYQDDQAQQHNVPRCDCHKKTNHQRDRLCKHTDNFNEENDRP